VPFLASEAPLALAWGRGERLLAIPALPARDVGLVCFPFGVSTRDAYTWVDEASGANQPRGVMIDVESLRSWDGVAALAQNDFASVVATRFAAIASALRDLRSSAAAERDPSAIALLAGSGATVFMIAQASRSDMFPVHSESAKYVHTRTATRVVAVEASD
jgi:4-diphosphocytidyl-2-C-methyl-D-erythritol kinase